LSFLFALVFLVRNGLQWAPAGGATSPQKRTLRMVKAHKKVAIIEVFLPPLLRGVGGDLLKEVRSFQAP